MKKAGLIMATMAKGSPTKQFFVGMLTRDIELSDAILDLLDNCLDGVVRQKGASHKKDDPHYYNGFFSHITVNENCFIIEDNCGGIPRKVAEEYAFRMGRSSDKSADDLPTVGIYGIGMKRAIFKIGQAAIITTRNAGKLYEVTVPDDWAQSDESWDFPIKELDDESVLKDGGTIIKITHVNQDISIKWNSEDKLDRFVNDLMKAIQQSYSFILQKGFSIEINHERVEPLDMQLLVSGCNGASINPFLYQNEYDDVSVRLAVGFYAPPPSPDEIDDENIMKRSSSDAGWTIVCNDRVVLYNDKSHLTGWGVGGVPQYHTQFIGIRGIVIFESNNPEKLPMTTTKRGIDTSSAIYAAVSDKMRQGLKMFTDYTNRWKGRNKDERQYSNAAKSVSVNQLTASENDVKKTVNLQFVHNRLGQISKPNLPLPANDKPYRRICFNKDFQKICDIKEFFSLDRNDETTPSQIGEMCFDHVWKEAKKEGE